MPASILTLLALLAVTSGCGSHRLTPLAAAARRGDLAEIERLIRAGAGPDEPSGINGWTPILHAIHKNQAAAAFLLAERGADVNRAGGDITPLIMAAGYGQDDIVAGLLDRGADPRRRNPDGRTALEAAVSGVMDIDAWTWGACQPAAVRVLAARAPDLTADTDFRRRTDWFAGRCPEVRVILARARARL